MPPKLKIDNGWLKEHHKPLIIAGPCSIETREQTLKTALEISKYTPATIYRAGIWKPRTRPHTFEGVGTKGLTWLTQVKEKTSLLTAVEISSRTHVRVALQHRVDVLWLGARTTVNPFLVQEIADVLKGHDVTVMVKNPINPDLDLWMGALERIYAAGIRRLVAVHRGFSDCESKPFRNHPHWKLVIELKTRLPDLPIVCDPSHIAGKHELIHTVSQRAMDLGLNGLMIETHINPREALSDARQQITPRQLSRLLRRLNIRKEISKRTYENAYLDFLKEKIDRVDQELLEILARRMEIIEEISRFKKRWPGGNR